MHRRIGRYRRSKHSKPMTPLKLSGGYAAATTDPNHCTNPDYILNQLTYDHFCTIWVMTIALSPRIESDAKPSFRLHKQCAVRNRK